MASCKYTHQSLESYNCIDTHPVHSTGHPVYYMDVPVEYLAREMHARHYSNHEMDVTYTRFPDHDNMLELLK